MSIYYMTHVGGLSQIVADELAERVPQGRVLDRDFGRLHVELDGDPTGLLALRTIENVYVRLALFNDVQPEKEWLEELETRMSRLDLQPALAALGQVRPLPQSPAFRVTAERTGRHQYRSPAVAGMAGSGVQAATGWQVDLRGHDIEVRIDVRETEALVGVRLSREALHKRSRLVHPRVTLNPTVAAAMVRLSEPRAGETVCDPMLGGGTILTERYDYDPQVTLIGGDLFAEKVEMARQNFVGLGVPAKLVQWNVRRLPLGDETVDKFICNPPWGNMVGDRALNRRIYPAMLQHLRRCLKPGGLMVLLTSERALVQSFMDKHPDITMVRIDRLNVGGLHPSLHVLRKDG